MIRLNWGRCLRQEVGSSRSGSRPDTRTQFVGMPPDDSSLLADTKPGDFEKFIREAITVEYRNLIITGGRQPDILLLEDNDQVRKFLGNFKLVAKGGCMCEHPDMLVFRKKLRRDMRSSRHLAL